MGILHEAKKFIKHAEHTAVEARKDIQKESVRFREHAQEEGTRFKKWLREHSGGGSGSETTFKAEYRANGDGTNGEYYIDAGPITYGSESGFNIDAKEVASYAAPQETYKGSRYQQITPKAYSRSTAATAKDIAQGGMTKEEIEEFNMKHPNETAKIGD